MPYSSFEFLDQKLPILVFGRDGQVGNALQKYLKNIQVPTVFLGRSDCDLEDESALRSVLNNLYPQVIINAAAYTAVDKAERDRELAFAINEKAPAIMAHFIANIARGIFVHYSTDYVFGDTKHTDYLETDPTGPVDKLSVYGQSKLAGELAIEKIFNLALHLRRQQRADLFTRYFILRTSWMYGDGDNFIRTILRLAGECNELKVVADQIGVPTSAEWLAKVGILMAESSVESGIYHAVPDGKISWHTLAVYAIKTAAMAGKRVKLKIDNILPVSAAEYPLTAPRPYNSRLNHQKLKKALEEIGFTDQYPHWQEQVQAYVNDYVKASLKIQ